MTWDMEVGEIDSRTAIQSRHGGSHSRGISAPNLELGPGDIMLWWRPEQGQLFGYADGWVNDGAFYFTGTGQVGDQRFSAPNAENGRVRDFRERGDRLRLLRYLGTNQVRYVGELELDRENPWQWRDGPDALGRTRKMIQFRMLPIGRVDHDYEQVVREPETPTATEALSAVPASPELAKIEALRKPEFLRLIRVREQMTRRDELQLVHTFRSWLLDANDLEATGLRIHTALGTAPLRADLFVPSRRTLIEAKASAAREHIRTAIGQLLDYGRYLEPPVRLCLLTPTQPAGDMLALLSDLRIAGTWPEGRAFVAEPAELWSAPTNGAP